MTDQIEGGWRVKFTNRSSAHMVYKQKKLNSCLIACVMMINFKLKAGLMLAGVAAGSAMQFSPGIGRFIGGYLSNEAVNQAIKSEEQVYKIYSKYSKTSYDGTDGAWADFIPQVLGELGCGLWECAEMEPEKVSLAIREATASGAPVIATIKWDNTGALHAVVVDEVQKWFERDDGIVCDPGSGELYVTEMHPGRSTRYRGAGSFMGTIVRRKVR